MCKAPFPPAPPQAKANVKKYCCHKCQQVAYLNRKVKRQIDILRKRKQRADARKLREAAKLNGTRAALPETLKRKPAGSAKKGAK